MVLDMLDNSSMVKCKDKVKWSGLMEILTRVSSVIILLMVKANTTQKLIISDTKGNINTESGMAKVNYRIAITK